MNQQIQSPSGTSVWSRKQVDFVGDIQPGGKTIASWRGAEWFLKFKDESTTEVIGYQLAEFLDLPVQPWLAVEIGEIEDTGLEKPNIGILIKKWVDQPPRCSLEFPLSRQPSLTGTALGLASLIYGDPEWMTDVTMSEFRLIDLEYCGPAIILSESDSWDVLIAGYLDVVRGNLCRYHKSAGTGLSAFSAALTKLGDANLLSVIDFSGHSRAFDVTRAARSFLQPAQRILASFSQCLVH